MRAMRRPVGWLTAVAMGAGLAAAACAATPEEEYLRAAQTASAHDIDSTAAAVPWPEWIQRAAGATTPIRWEVNDCGEATGSPADSAIDLPVCAEASVTIRGGGELSLSVAVGTMNRGVLPPPELFGALVIYADTSRWFYTLPEVEHVLAADAYVAADSIAYLDSQRDIHVVTRAKRDVRITREKRYRDPLLSPSGERVGALEVSTVSRQGAQTYEPVEVAEVLWLFMAGGVDRRITPGGFIRAWSFANGGRAVAVYSGGLHFAGFYELYDVETGERLARAEDPVSDTSPDWVRALAP